MDARSPSDAVTTMEGPSILFRLSAAPNVKLPMCFVPMAMPAIHSGPRTAGHWCSRTAACRTDVWGLWSFLFKQVNGAVCILLPLEMWGTYFLSYLPTVRQSHFSEGQLWDCTNSIRSRSQAVISGN